MTQHLDLDQLADVAAGQARAPEHLTGCAECTGALAELRTAQEQVRAQLAALPQPALPDGLADRLTAALVAERTTSSTVTTLPARPAREQRGPARWLGAAAAVALVLAGVTFGVTQLGGSQSRDDTTTAAGAGDGAEAARDVVRNDTGTDYTSQRDLAAAVPRLLEGKAGQGAPAAAAAPLPEGSDAAADTTLRAAAADPLARLRQTPALADCLVSLLPPEDPSVEPLALDYGTFQGAPAMVVVLPSALPDKLDVFVVGPQCAQADAAVLFYASVDRP